MPVEVQYNVAEGAVEYNEEALAVKVGPCPVPSVGIPCAVCWGEGKPFGVGDTPDIIMVQIWGITKSEFWEQGDGEPCNGVFCIPQHSACSWNVFLSNPQRTLSFLSAKTQLAMSAIGNLGVCFLYNSAPICNIDVMENESTNPNFEGGFAQITILDF